MGVTEIDYQPEYESLEINGNLRDAMYHLNVDDSVVNKPTKHGHKQTEFAIEDGGTCAMLRLLLVNGAEINVRTQSGFPPLALAIEYRGLAVVKQLVKYGANVNMQILISSDYEDYSWYHYNGMRPIQLARELGKWDIVDYLGKNGAY